MCRAYGILIALLAAAARPDDTYAQDIAASRPSLEIGTAVEEGTTMLVATVTLDGKPVEGTKVAFAVERMFGLMRLGEEETIDDGTAAVPFPSDLPGGPEGVLRIRAEITAPPEQAGVKTVAAMPGARVHVEDSEPFPRALWAPAAPTALILTIIILLSIAWGAYGYVLVQIRGIRRGASSACSGS
jgi:hypothetical protein